MSSRVDLYHWEPNVYFLKPLLALEEKAAGFTSRWFDPTQFEQFAPDFPRNTESDLQLEREGPVLVHGDTIISSSFFMLEYIAEALPGVELQSQDAFTRYRARAAAQFLGGLGADVSVLGCIRYLAPALKSRDPQKLRSIIEAVEPQERRNAWAALIDGTHDESLLTSRLQLPLGRVEQTLSGAPWLAGSSYSIADIDAFALLRPLPTLTPDLVNERVTPRIVEFLNRMHERPAVKKALALSRSGRPHEAFVPGAEPSRWG
ncbi:MAG: glutathione S-transferase family protein [Steroidobacteraceae bacterium]